MMLYSKIKLRTALLGDKHTGKGIRRFSRSDKRLENLPLEPKLWAWALSQAAESLSIPFSDDMVRVAPDIRCPTLVMHNRRYRKNGSGRQMEDLFESVRAGTVLTVPFIVFTEPAPDARVPGVIASADFRKVLEATGKMIGVSPWGSKFGYGRFTVVSLSENPE